MSPYYKYKKEKFLEKYKSANESLEYLKLALHRYREDNDKVTRRAIFAYFQDFSEYIIDMCESYLVINGEKVDSGFSSLRLIELAQEKGFFDITLRNYLTSCIKLRNRYTHDYYARNLSEDQIEEFCYSKIMYLEIFLENSKDSVILVCKDSKS